MILMTLDGIPWNSGFVVLCVPTIAGLIDDIAKFEPRVSTCYSSMMLVVVANLCSKQFLVVANHCHSKSPEWVNF